MSSVQNTVYYCCVSKGERILYAYSGDDPEIENLASSCLERTPAYHKWYFQTTGKKTFGFLMEDGCIYFAIVDSGLGNLGVHKFLEHVRDEFRKLATKKGSTRSMSNLNSLCLQEQLVPVIRHLITSLEHVSHSGTDWPEEARTQSHLALCPSPYDYANGCIEAGTSTKAPLLSKSGKHKKKMKDHVIAMRDIELEELQNSTDRGARAGSGILDYNNQAAVVSPLALQKDLGSGRFRSGSPNLRRKWCQQVRIILAIDATVCLVLFVVWLVICRGIECIR